MKHVLKTFLFIALGIVIASCAKDEPEILQVKVELEVFDAKTFKPEPLQTLTAGKTTKAIVPYQFLAYNYIIITNNGSQPITAVMAMESDKVKGLNAFEFEEVELEPGGNYYQRAKNPNTPIAPGETRRIRFTHRINLGFNKDKELMGQLVKGTFKLSFDGFSEQFILELESKLAAICA